VANACAISQSGRCKSARTRPSRAFLLKHGLMGCSESNTSPSSARDAGLSPCRIFPLRERERADDVRMASLCPSTPARAAQRGGLGGERRLQADGESLRIWYPEQADRDRRRRGWRSIASQPVSPAESSVSTLCPGKRRRRADESGSVPRSGLEDFHALVTHQLHPCPPMLPPTPLFPEQRIWTNSSWME
jgi:hypothetical protein